MRAGNFRLGSGTQKARRAPFDLTRAGRPELAFLWKNLLATAEYLRLRTALIVAALIVAACTWFAGSPFYEFVRPMLAMAAMAIARYTLLLGPQLARQDFRSDLHNTDILKTYPLRGWQIMLGEMLTPAAVLTGLMWLMLLAAVLLVPAQMRRMEWLTPSLRIGGALGLAVVTPLLCMVQLVIVNAAAVLLPAWQPGPGRPQQGIEVMGQRILFMAGQMLAMVLMLLPALIVAVLVFAVLRLVAGDVVAQIAAATIAVAALAVETGVAIAWLGERFEKLDLSQELRA
jgi:ABC-2 type transport system permease protein